MQLSEIFDIINILGNQLSQYNSANIIHNYRLTYKLNKENDRCLLLYQKKAKKNAIFEQLNDSLSKNIANIIGNFPFDELLPGVLFIKNMYIIKYSMNYLARSYKLNYGKEVGEVLNMMYNKNKIDSINSESIIKDCIYYLSKTNNIEYEDIIGKYISYGNVSAYNQEDIRHLAMNTIIHFCQLDSTIKNKYIPIITNFNTDYNYSTSYLYSLIQFISKLKLEKYIYLLEKIKEYYKTNYPYHYDINTNTVINNNLLKSDIDINIPHLCNITRNYLQNVNLNKPLVPIFNNTSSI